MPTSTSLRSRDSPYDTAVLAHQGGWDEILLVAAPIAMIVLVLWRATRAAERREVAGDEAGAPANGPSAPD
jgi:hypothetical protein